MVMLPRDYEKVAQAIALAGRNVEEVSILSMDETTAAHRALADVASNLADLFGTENPRFDRQSFINMAAG